MPDHIQSLAQITRHTSRTGRTTWTASGQMFTGRGAPMRALLLPI